MAHVKKYTLAASRKILDHCERENKVYKNEKIDLTRTCDNYSFEEFKNPKKYLKRRLSEVHCLKRKDVNVMCSWVVTLPEGLKPTDQNYNAEEQREMEKAFFQMSYEFLANRYGYINVVMADVHYDETTPHLHFGFVPVVYDQKKQKYKVSAKEVVNRADLKSFHKDFEDYFAKEMYRDVIQSNQKFTFDDCKSAVKKLGITNGKTKSLGGNRTIDQLKSENFIIETALERNKAENKKLREERKTFETEAEEARKYQISEIKKLNSEINILEQEKQDLHITITQAENDFLSKENIEDLENLQTKQVFNLTTLKTTDFENIVSEINFHRSKAEKIENIYQKRKIKLDQREENINEEVENRLLERLEEIRGVVNREIEEKRLEAQKKAQKDKEEHLKEIKELEIRKAQNQKDINFLTKEKEKISKSLKIKPKDFDFENFNVASYNNPVAAKLDFEFELYLKILKNADPSYIAERSFETYYKDTIAVAANNMDFTDTETNILMRTDNLLDKFYDTWLGYDFDEIEVYKNSNREAVKEVIQEHLPKKESLFVRAEEVQKEKSIGYEPEM